MTYELTVAEKNEIINQHIKNIEYSLFNLSLSLIEEESISSPSSEVISSLNAQISQATAKKTALLAELSELEG